MIIIFIDINNIFHEVFRTVEFVDYIYYVTRFFILKALDYSAKNSDGSDGRSDSDSGDLIVIHSSTSPCTCSRHRRNLNAF